MAGAETFVETAQWGRTKLDFLRQLLPFKRGIPSHDALNDVVNGLDADVFSECFSAWVASLKDSVPEPEPEIVAIDGKTSRRAHAREGHALHTVSAWAARQRLVLGQQATAEKSNEITAIPLLLERLQLAGALVTIDAMGCQTAIAQKVIDRGRITFLPSKTISSHWPARSSSSSPTRSAAQNTAWACRTKPSMPITAASKSAVT